MSWQSYLDTQLMGKGIVTNGAILGLQGGVWAASPGFTLSPEEQQAAVNAFKNPEAAQANGVFLAGKKYMTLSVDERSLYAKQGADGCALVKTNQAVLVGVYVGPNIRQQECVQAVEDMGAELIRHGF